MQTVPNAINKRKKNFQPKISREICLNYWSYFLLIRFCNQSLQTDVSQKISLVNFISNQMLRVWFIQKYGLGNITWMWKKREMLTPPPPYHFGMSITILFSSLSDLSVAAIDLTWTYTFSLNFVNFLLTDPVWPGLFYKLLCH